MSCQVQSVQFSTTTASVLFRPVRPCWCLSWDTGGTLSGLSLVPSPHAVSPNTEFRPIWWLPGTGTLSG